MELRYPRVLITGATGFIGSHLVPSLTARGYNVTCLCRRPSKQSWSFPTSVRVQFGDITDCASVCEAAAGKDAVIHLAAPRYDQCPDVSLHHRVTVQGTENLVRACQKMGVQRVIALSSISVTRLKLSTYAEAKRQAEQILLRSGLDVTILRPTLVYGPGASGIFRKLLRYVESLPVVVMLGSGDYTINPIFVGDVIGAIINCLENSVTIGKIYNLRGREESLSFKEFVDAILCALNRKKRKVRIPIPLALLGAIVVEHLLRNPPVSRDHILGIIQDTPVDIQPAVRDFGFNPIGVHEGMYRTFNAADALSLSVSSNRSGHE